MCGIWGFDLPDGGPVTPKQRELLAYALGAVNDIRGGDSWGAAIVNGSFEIRRGLGETWKDKDFRSLDLTSAHALLGHTRRATTGKPTIENSHPFEIGDYIGVHNGIISNHDELNRKHNRNFDVDSMHIFAHLDEQLDLKELKGYGAIGFMVKPDLHQIYLCRFWTGELAVRGIGDSKASKGVIWSSSKLALQDACRYAGIETFEFAEPSGERLYSVHDGAFWQLPQKLELGTISYSNYGTSEHYYNSAWQPQGKDECGTDVPSKGPLGKDKGNCSVRNTGTTSASSSDTTGITAGKAKVRKVRKTKRFEMIVGSPDWTIIRHGHVTGIVANRFRGTIDVSGHVESGDDKGSKTTSLPS